MEILVGLIPTCPRRARILTRPVVKLLQSLLGGSGGLSK